ncbi:DUF441 domain-containing protein [Calditerricola satsumensis]|uniref:UPF0756 membrane protein GCM10007043_12530 n=1 Tax=Calditerricola satsumensis TaxID=373054 RepID=A0A8J3FB15_9BACI|nr:DUF441 domain-containing protein [Calditerricola satsumensis]GGJ99959.1 UPF0756 membrane protein [Calditerricola satsumensis]
MNGEMMLLLLILIGLFGRSPVIATAASFLLILKLTALDRFLPTVERRGLELGLLFLMMSVLVPFASGKITWSDLGRFFTSPPGLLAILGGALATYLNGKGLELLRFEPELIVGLVAGSIIGIVFFKGIPVGPLMAAGLTVLFFRVLEWFMR